MPKLAIFVNSKKACAGLSELFAMHLNEYNIAQVFNGCSERTMKHLDQKMKELENANCVVFIVQISQMLKMGLTAEKLIRKYCIDKALIIWGQPNKNKNLQSNKYENTTASCLGHEITPLSKKKKYKSAFQADQWNKFFQCWPIETWPIFVQYEQLIDELEKSDDECFSAAHSKIHLAKLVGIMDPQSYCCCETNDDTKKVAATSSSCPLLMHSTLRSAPAPVASLFRHALLSRAKLPPRLAHLLPEPDPHICGASQNVPLIIRIVDPYIPLRAVQNVNDALISKQISSAGTWPKQLAAKLCTIYGFPVAIPCSNGFTALVLALRSANIGQNADVLMPSLTFVAVANAVLNVGANPIFVDSADQSADYNPSWSLLLRSATLNTRAVILTHTFGCPTGDIELIAAECKARGWTLIEDISECVGISTLTAANGEERLLGTFGDYACASLNSNKAAINGKINGLGAALACGVLDHLREIIAHRHLVASWYRAGLAQLFAKRLLVQMPRCGHRDTPWLFCVLCRSTIERTALRAHLAANSIETRNMFFPLHLEPMFNAAYADLDLPTAQLLASIGFALPTHPGLGKHQIEQIVKQICQFFNE